MTTLTVLGSCGGWPEAGRAASGFLLEHEGFRIVLDLGFGTLPRLLTLCPNGIVDAVAITHEHSDHCVDLNALFRVQYFGDEPVTRVPLYCTPGVVERVGAMEPDADLAEVFDIHSLPGSHQIGPFWLEGMALPHHVPNAGIRLSAPEICVAYTGDTAATADLVTLGRAADLFIVAALRPGEPTEGAMLTAGEAGSYAQAAGAKRLLLTHFWPGADRAQCVREARDAYDGEVIAADEGLTIEL